MIPSTASGEYLPSRRLLCSRAIGWRSLLLRTYSDPPVAEPFVMPASPDLRVVLNSTGHYRLACRESGRWIEADYRPGTLGMTAPGEQDELRWRATSAASEMESESVHLHLPIASIERFISENWDYRAGGVRLPSTLSATDPVLQQVLLSLQRAVAEHASELYAEAAAQYLVAHLLVRHSGAPPVAGPGPLPTHRLRRALSHMRERLGEALTLDDLAGGVSRPPLKV